MNRIDSIKYPLETCHENISDDKIKSFLLVWKEVDIKQLTLFTFFSTPYFEFRLKMNKKEHLMTCINSYYHSFGIFTEADFCQPQNQIFDRFY